MLVIVYLLMISRKSVVGCRLRFVHVKRFEIVMYFEVLLLEHFVCDTVNKRLASNITECFRMMFGRCKAREGVD
jgi:hypothetical protein